MSFYRLERSADLGEEPWSWAIVLSAPGVLNPNGLLIGQKGERVRWLKDKQTVELWSWDDRIPLNPGDVSCTDFVGGWRLLQRSKHPPSGEELAHFFAQ